MTDEIVAPHGEPRLWAAESAEHPRRRSGAREVEPRRSWVSIAVPALAIVLSALTLGLTFAHVLELPQKLGYGAEDWVSLTRPNALYRYFGIIGGPLEVLAVLAVTAVAVLGRRRRLGGLLAIAAAVMHAAALACWIVVVAPANVEIGRWSEAGIPPGWEQWRAQWEAGHAASFVLLLLGFSLLVVAVLLQAGGPLTGAAPRER